MHRDLKLENLILDSNFNVKLCDFGFATKSNPSERLTRILGTDGYMDYQLSSHTSYSGFKADIFALGVILFLLVNGFPPFYKFATI